MDYEERWLFLFSFWWVVFLFLAFLWGKIEVVKIKLLLVCLLSILMCSLIYSIYWLAKLMKICHWSSYCSVILAARTIRFPASISNKTKQEDLNVFPLSLSYPVWVFNLFLFYRVTTFAITSLMTLQKLFYFYWIYFDV